MLCFRQREGKRAARKDREHKRKAKKEKMEIEKRDSKNETGKASPQSLAGVYVVVHSYTK